MIYNILFLTAATINLGSVYQKATRHALYWLVFLLFFVFVACRWDVGCDWGSYFNHARLYRELPFDEAATRTEPLYWLLVTLLPKLGLDWYFINFFSSLSFFVGLHVLARRQPDRLMFLVLCFPTLITGIPMSAVRQALAMGFVMAAFVAFSDSKRWRYTALIVIGGLFHVSALTFLLLVPFVSRLELKRKFLMASVIAFPLLFLFSGSSSVEQYGSLYINSAHDAAGGPVRVVLLSLTAAIYLFAFRTKWEAFYPADTQIATLMSFAMIALFPVVLVSSVIGDRFGYYLAPIAYVMQSRFYLMSKQGYFVFFLVPILIGGISLFIWSTYSSIFQSCYLPYEHWFMEPSNPFIL